VHDLALALEHQPMCGVHEIGAPPRRDRRPAPLRPHRGVERGCGVARVAIGDFGDLRAVRWIEKRIDGGARPPFPVYEKTGVWKLRPSGLEIQWCGSVMRALLRTARARRFPDSELEVSSDFMTVLR